MLDAIEWRGEHVVVAGRGSDDSDDGLEAIDLNAAPVAEEPELRHDPRRRARRVSRVIWFGGAAAIFALGALVGWKVRGDGDGPGASSTSDSTVRPGLSPATSRPAMVSGAAGRMPPLVVAVTIDSQLVVLDARTGKQRRVLARDVIVDRGSPQLAVSPDGNTVYFDRTRRALPSECPDRLPVVSEIERVAIDGGPVRHVAYGRFPALSTDGTELAYGTRNDDRCPPFQQDAVTVVRLDKLGASALDGLGFAARDPARTSFLGLTWAPDNRHLLIGALLDPPDGSQYPRVLDTGSPRSLDDSAPVRISDATQNNLIYLGATGYLLGFSGQDPAGGPADPKPDWAVTIDPTSGNVRQRLFRLPVENFIASAGDSTGRRILAVASNSTLYRWSFADRRLTPIAEHIDVATWSNANE